eukprot:4638667-Pyramimonas_sp.AAC.1
MDKRLKVEGRSSSSSSSSDSHDDIAFTVAYACRLRAPGGACSRPSVFFHSQRAPAAISFTCGDGRS